MTLTHLQYHKQTEHPLPQATKTISSDKHCYIGFLHFNNYTTTRKGLTVEDVMPVTGVQYNWLLYFYKRTVECEMVFREHVCCWSCLCLPQNGRHKTGVSPLRRAHLQQRVGDAHTGLRARSH